MRHLLSLFDLTPETVEDLLSEATQLKQAWKRGERPALLNSRVLGMVFEKPSLRTRASFEAAMAQMGGSSIFLSATDGAIGKREPVADFARTLSQYTDAVVLRTFSHETIEEFARYSAVPVINGLSDLFHPCQALGDLLTMQEAFGELRGRTLVFVGDGNNVARSLAIGCGMVGMRFVLAAPNGYAFDEGFLSRFRQSLPHGEIVVTSTPQELLKHADIVYTDVWTSMGQEEEHELRLREFAPYQVNTDMLGHAPPHCKVMHCLPAHRGEEISEEVMEGNQSIIFEQAANRMHAQKAVLVWLMQGKLNGHTLRGSEAPESPVVVEGPGVDKRPRRRKTHGGS